MFNQLDRQTREEALREINLLPQVLRGVIPEERIQRWLNQVSRIDPQRISWHIRRLAGIGGSELASIMGLKGAYSTPEVIAKQKLLIIPPYRPSAAMKRGAASESFIRDLFEGAPDSLTDIEISENLRANAMTGVIQEFFKSEMDTQFGMGNWRPRPDLEALMSRPNREKSSLPEWCVGNADRIYEVTIKGKNYLVIVDFKAPSEKTAAEIRRNPEEKLIPWRSQVQHYGMILADRGFPPIALVLAVFDYANVGTKTFILDETKPSPEFKAMAIEHGNNFWNNFVLTGSIPVPAVEVGREEVPEHIRAVGDKTVYLAALRDAAKVAVEEAQEPIREWVLGDPARRSKSVVGAIGETPIYVPRTREKFDAEAAIFRLIDTGHVTAEQSLMLRGPVEPLPSADPRFAASITVAREKLVALENMLEQIQPGQSLTPDALENLKTVASQAAYCAKPVCLGEPKQDLVKQALEVAGEPASAFITHEVTVARSGTKDSSRAFGLALNQARELVSAYAEQKAEPINGVNQALDAPPVEAHTPPEPALAPRPAGVGL